MKSVLLLVALLFFCGAHAADFAPPAGKRLIGLALTMEETADPQLWHGQPGAVMSYTALPGLPGTTDPIDAGSGQQHLDALMRQYPHSALMLGLYLGNQEEAIARGDLDADIDRLIDLLGTYRRPVYLRFGYEFDGSWNHFDPDSYVAAWKRFRARMQSRGAKNIAMVWQASGQCGNTFRNLPIERWYPGDEQVDWVGISMFAPSACGGLVAEGLAAFARRKGKPLMIAESTPRGYDLAGGRYSVDRKVFAPKTPEEIWNEWYVPFFDFIDRNADVVRAVAYINGNWDAYPMWGEKMSPSKYWGDSRMEVDAEILQRWRQQTRAPAWRWGGPKLFGQLGYPPP